LRFLTGGNRQQSHHPGLDFVSATPSARADLTTSSEEGNFEPVFYLRGLSGIDWDCPQLLGVEKNPRQVEGKCPAAASAQNGSKFGTYATSG
jgi:hypothetical protein